MLCANAGVGSLGSIEELTVSEFSWIMQVNLFGVFYAVRAAVPYLKARVGARMAFLEGRVQSNVEMPVGVLTPWRGPALREIRCGCRRGR